MWRGESLSKELEVSRIGGIADDSPERQWWWRQTWIRQFQARACMGAGGARASRLGMTCACGGRRRTALLCRTWSLLKNMKTRWFVSICRSVEPFAPSRKPTVSCGTSKVETSSRSSSSSKSVVTWPPLRCCRVMEMASLASSRSVGFPSTWHTSLSMSSRAPENRSSLMRVAPAARGRAHGEAKGEAEF